jgi:threonine dehydratase
MTEHLVERIAEAAVRIRPHVRETPVVQSSALGEAAGAEVWLKCENLQVTGSFKVRGATNRLLTLPEATRRRGVVAASSGNHGIAVSHAGQALGIPVAVYVPEFVSPAKMAAMRRLGAAVTVFGTDGLDTEVEARRAAESEGRCYVSPYNDLAVVAGQGTIGVELRRQLDGISAVVVAVGGGGLIGGIAADLKRHDRNVRVIGAQPVNSRVMIESVRAGRVVDIPSLPTLSDGTAGGLESDSVTFPLCRDLVDEWVEVPEAGIARAMRHSIELEHLLIEGSAAVALAAVAEKHATVKGRVVVILCGANISADRLRSAL